MVGKNDAELGIFDARIEPTQGKRRSLSVTHRCHYMLTDSGSVCVEPSRGVLGVSELADAKHRTGA